MADTCEFDMRITGEKLHVDEMIEIIQAEYNNAPDDPRHLWRIFHSYVEELEEVKEGIYTASVSGNCAWSVYSCMCDGPNTYQQEFPDGNGTTLKAESERLHLVLSVDSCVLGEEGFSESMVFRFGEKLFHEVIQRKEVWYDEDEYGSLEAFNEAHGLNVDQEWLDETGGEYVSFKVERSEGTSPENLPKPEDEFP